MPAGTIPMVPPDQIRGKLLNPRSALSDPRLLLDAASRSWLAAIVTAEAGPRHPVRSRSG